MGAANGDAAVVNGNRRTAVQVIHVVFRVFLTVELAGAFPPEIMIASDDDLMSRQGPDFIEVFLGFCQMHGPRRIAGNEDRIVFADSLVPIVLNALPMVNPAGTEHIHRLAWRIAG